MNRFSCVATSGLVLAMLLSGLSGCEVSVDGAGSVVGDDDDGNGGNDPGNSDPGNTSDPGTTSDPGGDVGSLEACSRTFRGAYGGAADGDFDATVDAASGTVDIRSVSSQGVLDGVLTLDTNGHMSGDNQGYWMDGSIDVSDCSMSGDWGVVDVPGVAAGWWEAGD